MNSTKATYQVSSVQLLHIGDIIESTQITALLGTARILRRVMNL